MTCAFSGRLDATTSARELTRGLIAHVEMANRLLARASRTPYARDVAAAASEAAGLAARRDSGRVDEAYRLACEALGVGITYSSERVIERARRFRRVYPGPATSYVREFDDQLRTALQ